MKSLKICATPQEQKKFLQKMEPSSVFILVDENTLKHCYPKVKNLFKGARLIQVKSGEAAKNIETCKQVWNELLENLADRNSVLVNLGGGVICDTGAFCAATFKRGIRFIHFPTTTLAISDAAIGGKTGVDFHAYKNIIGTFTNADAVFLREDLTDTLPEKQVISGSAEMFKHALLSGRKEMKPFLEKKFSSWGHALRERYFISSIKFKSGIVNRDPVEKSVRKILNLGHTFGHAFESCLMDSKTPLLHGEAVALGLIAESCIAVNSVDLKTEVLRDIIQWYRLNFTFPAQLQKLCLEEVINFMRQDKKNRNADIRMALLKKPGKAVFDIEVSKSQVTDALSYLKKIGNGTH
jgi:3-dehydroquinate synthase